MSNDQIISNLYILGHHYLMMWYPEISLEDYHKWFMGFNLPQSEDNLIDLMSIWVDITYRHFVLKENELILYNMYIDGLNYIRQYENIPKKKFKKWFGKITERKKGKDLYDLKYTLLRNISYYFIENARYRIINILYKIGRNIAVDHLNSTIKEYNKFFYNYEFPYLKNEMESFLPNWCNIVYLKFNKNVISKKRKWYSHKKGK